MILHLLAIAFVFAGEASTCENLKETWQIVAVETIDTAWSGHPVAFALWTQPPYQYVAYYNAEQEMIVAGRTLDSPQWQFKKLPSKVGWDSHNSLELALDRTGCLHISGNMHVTPLVYFRMTRPHDLESITPFHRMVGENEGRVTYPQFVTTPQGELIFFYRDGASGQGRQLFNIYDAARGQWRRLLNQPLLDGGSEMSAYPSGPLLGPDGYWHLCWVWRDTPDCSTNHDISYARSRDLVHWETVRGEPVMLPVTPSTAGVVVDPVPVKQGLINVGHRVGFDWHSRPIVTYHKYDDAGNSQIFNARWEQDRWVIYQTSHWSYRWDFSGPGSIDIEILAGPIRRLDKGRLAQGFTHRRYGSGTWILDEHSLQPVEVCQTVADFPPEIQAVESNFPGMQVNIVKDSGRPPRGEQFLLRWESLPPNRDRPHAGPLPPPSSLRLYHLRSTPQSSDSGS